jgi:hypothetical protein
MIIYLKHPIHGTKVATLEAEADADKQNGWVEFDPTNREEEKKEAPDNELRRRRRQDAA